MDHSLIELQARKPTTLDEVKSLARSLARVAGLNHSHSLNAASRQAGHKDWPAALKALRNESH